MLVCNSHDSLGYCDGITYCNANCHKAQQTQISVLTVGEQFGSPSRFVLKSK